MKNITFNKTFRKHMNAIAVVACSVAFGLDVAAGELFGSIAMATMAAMNYYFLSEDF